MAPVKFERVISVSSEDPVHPAENLLKISYTDKKWKCKSPGEKQITVVLQLEKAAAITGVDVGNYGSAFIEIFVGKSSTPDDYKVLVVASSLMTLQEAKLGTNLTSVRFFKEDSLSKLTATEKWDRIKVICSQPYNKLTQYGLSFVVVHTSATSSEHSATLAGTFQFKVKDPLNDIIPGSLFAKRKDTPSKELKGAAAIRAASTSGLIQKKNAKVLSPSSSTVDREEIEDCYSSGKDGNSSVELRKNTPKQPKIAKHVLSPLMNGSVASGSSSPSSNRKANQPSSNAKDVSKKKLVIKKRTEKPFNQLLEGVIFTISGFQNPYRSELRSKALALGAKYKADWDNSCTHLLCAFTNTPKFNQVLGHGKIVSKEWVERCYIGRIRIPWRRFALHPPDKQQPESEEEIYEYVERPPSPVDNRRRVSPPSSGEDTEEEIERVRQLQTKVDDESRQNNSLKPLIKELAMPPDTRTQVKERKTPDYKANAAPLTRRGKGSNYKFDSDNEIYDLDTEEELETSDANQWNLPFLPTFFEDKNFFICLDLSNNEKNLVKRHIIAHKGSIVEDINAVKELNYVISESTEEVNRIKKVHKEVIGVRPDWVWKAHHQSRIPPTLKFEV